MIIVMEIWHLKLVLEDKALELMQMMDEKLGPQAHIHPGWCGHARFYQSFTCLTDVFILYPWRSRELHEDLVAQEEPLLKSFYNDFCTTPREINYYTELPVEVEHEEFDDYHG
ncbi:hypothetical protein [Nostoc sp. PA-18-2419]|uniref:hypothetical protein n=1 Tax=Nostoc sp. PA-18-2419 TaxID=2575443 RepID=UPI001CB8F9A0|nr:hypothetical protein [Nostoc sp. PA-18-2419]